MKKLYVMIFVSALLLTSCSGADVNPDYVDVSQEEVSQSNSAALSGKDVRRHSETMSSDGVHIYKHNSAIDTKAKTVQHTCTKPGCLHDNSECYDYILDSGKSQFYLPYDGGFIFTQQNEGDPDTIDDNYHSLSYLKDGKITELYKNTYSNSYEAENYGDKGGFILDFADEEGIFCKGPNYLFKVSYTGELLAEPIEPPEGETFGTLFLTDDKNILISINTSNTIIKVDLKNHTSEKLFNLNSKCVGVYYKDRIYWNQDGTLVSCDMTGNDIKKLADIDAEELEIAEGGNSIIYVPAGDAAKLYKINLETMEQTLLLDLKDAENITVVGDLKLTDPCINWPEYIPNMNAVALQMQSGDKHNCRGVVGLNGENPTVYSTEFNS